MTAQSQHPKSIKTALLAAASGAALFLAAPQAMAQCSPGAPVPGDTVTCTAGAYPDIQFSVDDLTLIVGSNSTPSTVGGGLNPSISLTGDDDQRVDVRNAGSYVYSFADTGIYINSTGGTGNVIVNQDGSTYGYYRGIYIAGGNAAGFIRVTADGTTGSSVYQAIGVRSSVYTTSVTVNANSTVSGGTNGIYVRGYHSGATIINAGDVSAGNNNTLFGNAGIYVANRNAAGGGMTITANTINSATDGIIVGQFGTGNVSVDVNDVSGLSGDGVYLFANNSADLALTTTGSVSGSANGIRLRQLGTGDVSINAQAVTATNLAGVLVEGNTGAGDLAVRTYGTVEGSSGGIRMTNAGTGESRIFAGDDVNISPLGPNSYGAAAIFATSTVSTTDMSIISATDLNGNSHGLYARHNGTGYFYASLNEASTRGGEFYGGDEAINVVSGDATTTHTLLISGDVVGYRGGVYARHEGSGDMTVTSTALISTFQQTAVEVINEGLGATNVSLSDVTVSAGNHIEVTGGATTTNMTFFIGPNINPGSTEPVGIAVNTGYAVGDVFAFLTHTGTGFLNITALNRTFGGAGDAAIINTTANTTDLTLLFNGGAEGDDDAIDINHFGSGDITLTTNGTVLAFPEYAVNIYNSAAGGNITVNATYDFYGYRGGITVDNDGSGDVMITGTNMSGSGTPGSYGVRIDSVGGTVSVNLNGQAGGERGIYINNTGTGDTIVEVDGVASTYNDIQVTAAATTGDLRIVRGDSADGSSFGIALNSGIANAGNTNTLLSHDGTGSTYISAAGASTTGSGDAVSATTESTTTDATFIFTDALTTTGSGNALDIDHRGSGALDIQITSASSVSSRAIDLDTEATGTDMILTASGLIEASSSSGVYVQHRGSGNLTIDVQSVTATSGDGFDVEAYGSGDVSISVAGTINATAQGIDFDFYGHYYGNYSAGFIDIEVNNVVMGNATDLAVAVNTYNGYNTTTDGVRILTNGAVNGEIEISVNNVINNTNPTDNAIEVDTGTSQFTYINTYGSVDGGRFGIVTSTVAGTQITVGSGSSINGGTSGIRLNGNVDDRLFLSGTIDADALLLGGSDTFIMNSGGDISAGARVDLGTGDDVATMETDFGFAGDLRGGLGTDTIFLAGSGGTWDDSGRTGNRVRQFENIVLNSTGWTLTGVHFNYDNFTVNDGSHTLDGRMFADTVNINAMTSLDMADAALMSRTIVQLDGTLDIGGSGTTGAASILGTLNMGATGVINIDALGVGDNDLLRLTGNFANQGTINLDGNGTLNLNQTYALTTGQYVIINAVQSLSGEFATVNGLGSGGGLQQSLIYNTANNTVRVLTEVTPPMTPETGSKSSASAASYLLSQLGQDSEYAELGWNVGVMDTAGIADFAAGITPDVLDSAVMVSDGAALRFGQSLAGCDVNFSLNAAESCAADAGQSGPAMFGEMRQTSANTGTEVGHSFNAQSFDMTVGLRLTDSDDRTQFGLMSGYAKSGSVSNAIAGESRDGLEAESFSFGGYARRDAGWWSLDGTAMVSTSEAKLVRNITPGLGIAEQAQSEFVSRQFNLQGTATLNGLGSSEFWIKPLATVGNRTLQRDGFTEAGADLLGLTVEGQTRNVSYAGLGAEFAPDFTDEDGNGFRGLLRVTGLAYAGDTESDFTARFTNAPGDSSFTYFGQNLDTSVLLEGGFQYIAGDGFAIGAEGFGEVSPETGDSSTVGATLQLIKRW